MGSTFSVLDMKNSALGYLNLRTKRSHQRGSDASWHAVWGKNTR
ncbi:MAG: hypothetical protein Q6373_002020 [Candidatus Sigynarchaeota archaeon]